MLTLHVNWKVFLHIHVFLKMGVSITRLSFFAVKLTYFFFLSIVGWFVNKLPSGIVIAWSRGKLLRIAGKPTKIFLMTIMTSMTCFIRSPNQTLILPRQESVPRKCRMVEEDSEECERKASVWTHRNGCVDDRKGSSLICCFYLHHTKHTKKRVTTCPMIDCSLQRCVNLVSGWVIFESNQGMSWTPWYFKHLVQQDSISFITFCQKRCGIKTITLCITNWLILESYFQVSNTNSDYRQGHFLSLSSSNVCRTAGSGLCFWTKTFANTFNFNVGRVTRNPRV